MKFDPIVMLWDDDCLVGVIGRADGDRMPDREDLVGFVANDLGVEPEAIDVHEDRTGWWRWIPAQPYERAGVWLHESTKGPGAWWGRRLGIEVE